MFLFFHIYYSVDKGPATVCDLCLGNNTGLSGRLGEGKGIFVTPQHRSGAFKESIAWHSEQTACWAEYMSQVKLSLSSFYIHCILLTEQTCFPFCQGQEGLSVSGLALAFAVKIKAW